VTFSVAAGLPSWASAGLDGYKTDVDNRQWRMVPHAAINPAGVTGNAGLEHCRKAGKEFLLINNTSP
jgi:hypothetical protein